MIGAFELAHPQALWGLAIAVPVLAAHLYRRRRRAFAVAFVPLVRETVGPVRARGAWKRLRDAVRLACRVLAVAALAMALAGPRPVATAPTESDLVIVIDADPTTTAQEHGGPLATRFDRAVALARAHVLAHGAGHVGVVVAADSPRSVAAPTQDRASVVRVLDEESFALADGRGDLDAAVAAARASRRAGVAQRIVVVTSRATPSLEGAQDVVLAGAGEASDDQGFVDAAVEPAADGAGVDLTLVLRNATSEPRERRVRFAWGPPAGGADEAFESRVVPLAARSESTVRVDLRPPRAGALVVATLEGDDAWDRNDTFAAFVAPRARPSVLVVHGKEPRPYLRALLDALGDTIDRDASGFVGADALRGSKPRDVTFVDGVAIDARAMTSGAWVFLAPLPGGDGLPFRAGRDVREPLVWRVDATSPFLRGVDLTTAYVARATTLAAEGATVLASVEGDAVVAHGRVPATGGSAVTWFAFGLDPDGSDLPLRAALPLLLRNAVRVLGEAPRSPLRPFYRAGEVVESRAPLDVVSVRRTPPARLRRPERAASIGGPATLEAALPLRARAAGAESLQLESADGSSHKTATVTLDRAYDVAPARPASPPPPRAPSPPSQTSAPLVAWLLVAAASLLVLDLALGLVGGSRGGRKNVAGRPIPA